MGSITIVPKGVPVTLCSMQGFIQQFWEKATGQNCGKNIDSMSKLGKIINIKLNYGSKIYPKNQVILDCFMLSTSV